MNSKIICVIFCLVCLIIFPGCAAGKGLYGETRVLLGTYVTIKTHDTDRSKSEKQEAVKRAFSEIERIEGLLSSFKKGNIIDKINSSGTKEVFLDKETFYVLEKAKYFNEISDGAFDITVLPILELWGFHKKNYSVPSYEKIEEALARAGSDKMILDKNRSSVRFLKDGMSIDLGGIAKGYAVDRAAAILMRNGIKNGLIDAGGDIYCFGRKQKGKKWSVGIRDPRYKNSVIERLDIEDSAVVTSGGYENFFERAGKRYGHIINPKTGYPVENNVVSVTIITTDCLTADALATAAMVLGKEKGAELVEGLKDIKAIIMTKEGADFLEVMKTR
jgi:FAD:protein FMN transferase